MYACTILPDHVHRVFARHPEDIDILVGFLKRAATRQLNREEIHPLREFRRKNGEVPTPWVVGGWHRFLNDQNAIVDAIKYVRENPTKIGFKEQTWSFIFPFPDRRI